jgi:hypothetical protein
LYNFHGVCVGLSVQNFLQDSCLALVSSVDIFKGLIARVVDLFKGGVFTPFGSLFMSVNLLS